MATLKEVALHMTLEASGALGRAVHATPAVKLDWKPSETGRSIMEIFVEAAGANRFMASLLRERAMPKFDAAEIERAQVTYDTVQKALELLREGTDELAAAIDHFPEESLSETITLPFGGGVTRSFTEILLMPYYHMNYHLGQINYIQTLYGDREMH